MNWPCVSVLDSRFRLLSGTSRAPRSTRYRPGLFVLCLASLLGFSLGRLRLFLAQGGRGRLGCAEKNCRHGSWEFVSPEQFQLPRHWPYNLDLVDLLACKSKFCRG